MAQPSSTPRMTEADYLAWESTQARRHEYVEGRVYAVHDEAEPAPADAADPRAAVAPNLAAALHAHLRGTACRVHRGDLRLYLSGAAAYLYPDLVVSCPGAARERRVPAAEPVFIADVLSPGAGSLYPGVRFTHYRGLPSLREYLLIDAHRRGIDLYRKGADGLWALQQWAPGEAVRLASLDLRLPAAALFAGLP